MHKLNLKTAKQTNMLKFLPVAPLQPSQSLTPSDGAELEHVRRDVGVEDLDERQVHVHGFQAHPHEGGQQQVVLDGSRGDGQAVAGEGREPGVEQEEQVEAQQGSRQVDEDLRGVVEAQLPVKTARQVEDT